MNEIEKLLKGGFSFDEGFALFCKWSKQPSLMSWIGRKRDYAMLKYNLEKLSKGLPRISNQNAAGNIAQFLKAPEPERRPQQAASAQQTQPSVSDRHYVQPQRTKIYRAELPPFLQILYDLNADDYRRMSDDHRRMADYALSGDAEKAAECRAELTELSDGIKKRWKKIEEEYASYRAQEKVKENAPLPFKESTYRSYISRYAASTDPEVRSEVMKRVQMMLRYHLPIKEKTMEMLRKNNIIEQE